ENVAILDNKSTFKRTYTAHHNLENQKTYIGYLDDLVVYDTLEKAKKITYKGKSIFAIDFTETEGGIVWVSTFKDGVFGIVNDKIQFDLNESNGLISNQ